jgi:hypothetical protein
MKVRIWVPTHRTPEAMFCLSLLGLQEHELKRGVIDLKISFLVGESLIPRARNTIANKFLNECDDDYLFMLDSDLIFEPNILEKLLDHGEKFIGANYAQKTSPLKMAGVPDDPNVELSKASFIPTGAMLIHRDIFEKLIEKGNVPVYKSSEYDKTYGFFNCFIEEEHGTYLSEDWAFAHRCKSDGVTGCIDNFIRLGHIGQRIYKQ